jgi:hypothetical protein
MNSHKLGPRFRRELHERRAESWELMIQFMQLAELVEEFGGTWSYEWPAYCFGWKIPALQDWFGERSSYHARFDGCRFGLKDRKGNPIKKPWAIMTSCRMLAVTLDDIMCKCPRGAHAPCEGSVASQTENYTRALAEAAIKAILLPDRATDLAAVRPDQPNHQRACNEPVQVAPTKEPKAAKGLTALQMHSDGHVDLDYASFEGLADENGDTHRGSENCGCSGALGMVTRIISPREPEFHSKRGKAAIEAEVSDLRAESVWDEGSVKEWAEVRHERKDGYPPMVGLLFLIMGQKHAELDTGSDIEDPNCPFRARAVFQGSNVRTGDGTPAWMLYQEVGATPSSMASTQMALACGALKGSRATTRDARKAYIQSFIDKPGRPRTWLRLPKALWPKSWFYADGTAKYRDPVVILKKALYGHPESGPMWDKKLHQCMRTAGFKALEGSPGFFYDPVRNCECTVYVDDFVLVAQPSNEASIWRQLDKLIDFKDPPEPISRHFGVYHHLSYSKDGKVTTMAREGRKYLEAVVRKYCDETGAKSLPWVASPSLDDTINDETQQPGKQATTAASHLMSILYIARLCRADVVVTTSFLARRVAKWTVNEDRRLKRLMSYISHHLDLVLVHRLSTDDRPDAELVYSPDAELGGDVMTTKATGGFWLEVRSKDDKHSWPVCWATKKASHTSTATADSETWSLVGANELGLKREVIPLLHQMEVSLGRLVRLRGLEDNTQCIAAIQRGYSPALRHLQRHCRLSLGFTHEVFFPDRTDPDAPQYISKLEYCETSKQKGDWMTKENPPNKFQACLRLAGYVRAEPFSSEETPSPVHTCV